MITNRPLLSLCIPTNGVKKWLIPVLESIYEQEVDISLFEVVITNNSQFSQEFEDSLLPYKKFSNFIYKRTNAVGFLNQIDCFFASNGNMIKLVNHRAKLLPGTIEYFLDFIRTYGNRRPVAYFSNGMLRMDEVYLCSTFDKFMFKLSYWSRWSAGLVLWREDLFSIQELECDTMFPHLSLLSNNCNSGLFVIDDKHLFCMQDEAGKGGYNVFNTFAVHYLNLIRKEQNLFHINEKTYKHIKYDLYFDFFRKCYFDLFYNRKHHCFDLENTKEAFKVNYSIWHYYALNVYSVLYLPVHFFKKIVQYVK